MKQGIKKNYMLSFRELSVFCEQVAMVVSSGVLIHTGILMMAEDSNSASIKALLTSIADSLEDNQSLAQSLKSTGAFPQYLVSMVQIGEESGKLDGVLDSLADFYNRQHLMVETVKSAVFYPGLLVVMMLTVFLFLTAKVLPVFQNVFHSLGAELPSGVLMLLKMGSAVNSVLPVLLIVAIFVVAWFIFLFKTQKGFTIVVNWIARQRFSEEFSLYCFTSSMSLMLNSGVDARQAMEMAFDVVLNENLKVKCKTALDLIEEQDMTFAEAMETAGVLPPAMTGMLAMGVKTGNMDKCLDYIANIFNENFQQQLAKKVNLVEPVSVAVLSILIGLVLVAVMLPLLGIMSSIG